MGDMEIPDELIDQLLGEYQGPEQLTGPAGLINQLRKRLIERAAGAELEQHLGYRRGAEPPEQQPNRRNGLSSKTLRTVDGPLRVELPRDRDASFEPRIVPKHARSFDGVDVSDGLISEVTASIQDEVRPWQGRPREELYDVVYLKACQVPIWDQQVVRKKAVYVAVGVTLEGARDCLGLWLEKTEGARFWTSVLTELRNRGVKDVLFVCTDGLSGFPEAIDAVFPLSVNQTCIVHLVRQSLRYLSWKERKSCAGELRRIYTAADADAARQVLDELTAAWAASKTRTAALQVWDRAWERVIPFLAFTEEIRRIVYTTNAVESLHMQIRKTIKTRGHFPNDEAALRLIWLAIQRAKSSWKTCYNWTNAMAVLRIHFGDRFPDNTSPPTDTQKNAQALLGFTAE